MLTAWHGIEFRGSRHIGTAPDVPVTSGDAYGVLIYQDLVDVSPLWIDTQFNAASDLTKWRNNGADQAAIGALGTLRMGGLQGRIVHLNPGAGVTVDWLRNTASWIAGQSSAI